MTSSSLCTFGDQFKLIYTPDMQTTAAFKLNASNPGQFYYNVFTAGQSSVDITIPYPFVTQGAVPVHVYSSVTTASNGQTCYTPGDEVAGVQLDGVPVTWSYPSSGDKTITVSGLPAGFSYIAVHLDYGLKGTLAYSKNAITLEASGIPGTPAEGITIENFTDYQFSDTAGGSDTIQNVNVFKKDPGIGGLVLTSSAGDPIVGASVAIYQGSKLVATVQTDEDGWYMWNYKYTGKAATFTVKLPAYDKTTTVTLKSNGYLLVNFTV